jgi:hypothetical protein
MVDLHDVRDPVYLGPRMSTVRYFKQMNPNHTYPVVAIISKKKIAPPKIKEVAQVEGREAVRVKRANPFIEVRAHFPGCIAVPDSVRLDVSGDQAVATIWVTPVASGAMKEARVEIWYEGTLIEAIATPFNVVSQSAAKASLFASLLSLVAEAYFQMQGDKSIEALEASAKAYGEALLASPVRLGLFGGLIVLAFFLWLIKRPRQSAPVEQALDIRS